MDERRGAFERRDDRACRPELCERLSLSSLPAVSSSPVSDADSSIGFAASSVLGDAFSWGVQHETPDRKIAMRMFDDQGILCARARVHQRGSISSPICSRNGS
jgi:hypothetical protein